MDSNADAHRRTGKRDRAVNPATLTPDKAKSLTGPQLESVLFQINLPTIGDKRARLKRVLQHLEQSPASPAPATATRPAAAAANNAAAATATSAAAAAAVGGATAPTDQSKPGRGRPAKSSSPAAAAATAATSAAPVGRGRGRGRGRGPRAPAAGIGASADGAFGRSWSRGDGGGKGHQQRGTAHGAAAAPPHTPPSAKRAAHPADVNHTSTTEEFLAALRAAGAAEAHGGLPADVTPPAGGGTGAAGGVAMRPPRQDGDPIYFCVMDNGEVRADITKAEKDAITHQFRQDFNATWTKPPLYSGPSLTLFSNLKVPGSDNEWGTWLTWRTILHQIPENMGLPRSSKRNAWNYIKNLQTFFAERNVRVIIVQGHTNIEIAEEAECPNVCIKIVVRYKSSSNECWITGETATVHKDFQVGLNNYGFGRKEHCWYANRCSVAAVAQLLAVLDDIGCLLVEKQWE